MKTKKAPAKKANSKKTSTKSTPKKRANTKVKTMTIKEIASACAEQLREQHKAYNKFRERLDGAGGQISVELARRMIDSVVMSDRDAKDIIEGFILYACNEVEEKGQFIIPGMVKVFARLRKAAPKRKGRNPATGEEIMLKARKADYKPKATPLAKAKAAIAVFTKKNPPK